MCTRNQTKYYRKALFGGAALVALQIASLETAWAADAAGTDAKSGRPAAETTTLDEIVVTGIVRSNLTAIHSKLNAVGISDVISANEVQALPDLTIVEALRRVPGLSVLPATDNEHPRDEAATPVIRGLGPVYNNVTLDGLPVASPGIPNGTSGTAGRGVRLDILPSSMISELSVVKTFTAELDPNAIGGAVDLKTRSAFQHGGESFFTLESALGAANDQGQPRPQDPVGYRIVSTGSFTFGPDHKYGLVASANYQQLDTYTNNHATTDSNLENFYDSTGALVASPSTGNGIPVPQQDKFWYLQDHRTRYGLTGKFEAQLSSNLYAFATIGTYRFQDTIQRNELIIDSGAGTSQKLPVLNQTATSGGYGSADMNVGFQRDNVITNTKVAQFGADWRPTEHQLVSVRADVSRATYREPFTMYKYQTGVVQAAPGTAGVTSATSAANAFTYDTSSFFHAFYMPANAYYNLGAYQGLYWRPDAKRSITDSIRNLRTDYRYNAEKTSQGWGFAAGVSYTEDTPSYEIHRPDYEPNTNMAPISLVNAIGPMGTPLPMSKTGLNMLTIDPTKANAAFQALRAGGGLNRTNTSAFDNQDNFTHEEKTVGVYALGTYNTEKLHAQFGLHNDHTDQNTTGRAKVAGVWGDLPTQSSYDYLLPSALATYKLTPDLDVRFGASQTIGRPSYDSYAARSSINFANASDLGNANAQGVTVSVGNPGIKPRKSNNLDLAVDYTLSNKYGGLLSIAVFNKDIKDEIFAANSMGYTYEGVNYANAVVTKPTNATSASVSGVELDAVVNSLEWVHPWLTYFGASGNWSLLNGSMDVLTSTATVRKENGLVGQPDEMKNATLFYNHDGLELRAAWTFQGKALRSITPNIAWQDLYFAPREQVDVQASYKFNSNLTLFAQASNLTHTRLTSVAGPYESLLKDSYSVPTTFWLGIRYTPGK